MMCFNCEMQRACDTCLERRGHKKTFSTDINMFKRRPANKYHQMVPYYIGEYELKLNNFDFESAEGNLMTAEKPMLGKRCNERVKDMITCISYMKNEDNHLEKRDIYLWIQTK